MIASLWLFKYILWDIGTCSVSWRLKLVCDSVFMQQCYILHCVTLCISAVFAVARCLSHWCIVSRRLKIWYRLTTPRVRHSRGRALGLGLGLGGPREWGGPGNGGPESKISSNFFCGPVAPSFTFFIPSANTQFQGEPLQQGATEIAVYLGNGMR